MQRLSLLSVVLLPPNLTPFKTCRWSVSLTEAIWFITYFVLYPLNFLVLINLSFVESFVTVPGDSAISCHFLIILLRLTSRSSQQPLTSNGLFYCRPVGLLPNSSSLTRLRRFIGVYPESLVLGTPVDVQLNLWICISLLCAIKLLVCGIRCFLTPRIFPSLVYLQMPALSSLDVHQHHMGWPHLPLPMSFRLTYLLKLDRRSLALWYTNSRSFPASWSWSSRLFSVL